VLGADDKTRHIRGIRLDELDAVEGWVREICNDQVQPALDANIRKLELESAGGQLVPVVRIDVPRSGTASQLVVPLIPRMISE
jgi:ATP-dependent DNA helicase RecG